MTNDPFFNHLRELSWRRKLTDAEAAELGAWLAAHPEALAGWETEAGLNDALARLPDAPVSSNFTARVLQVLEREGAADVRARQPKWRRWPWRLHWLPKAALVAILLGVGVLSVERHRQAARRVELARILKAVSVGSATTGPEALQDFDTVRAYTIRAVPDEELLALLK